MKNTERFIWISFFLVIQMFCLRYAGFSRTHNFTFDEGLYMQLGAQMSDNFTDYSTAKLYKEAAQKGRDLPEHYNKPLFVHPPLFPFLISISFKIFGKNVISAFFVSAFFGVLLVPLAYFLGSALFGERVGLLSALLMSIEPISWICSQKIWMETTLAFFMLLALLLFCRGVKEYNPRWMFASGIASGCAVLTKYPGFLVVFAIPLYALCCERWLFKKKTFLLSLCVPFVMFLPWVFWNCSAYGAEGLNLFFKNPSGMTGAHFYKNLLSFVQKCWWVLFLAALVPTLFALLRRRKVGDKDEKRREAELRIIRSTLFIVVFCAIVIMLRTHIMNALRLSHVPKAGWAMGMFRDQPWYFYLGRIIELSPLYLFSYLALVVCAFDMKYRKQYALILAFVGCVLTFFIIWTSFQSRYIVSVTVPLVILSARTQIHILGKLEAIQSKKPRYAALLFFLSISLYFVLKTLMIDFAMAIPNKDCYF